ncbi:MAG: transcriptional repressor LexA [Elusimicrobia bacterium]|nr:transcriptional repressor LexA [Elusimicrobiota bacterium]
MEQLTEKQKAIIDFIRNIQTNQGTPPTMREIMKEFGFKSIGTVQDYLRILEEKGYLRRRGKFKARFLDIVGLTTNPVLNVPVLGQVRAGAPILAVENIDGYINLDKSLLDNGADFALRVKGDSMTGAGIYEGDFVLVRINSRTENGEIVVARIGEEVTVKKIYCDTKYRHLRLEAANPAYKPISDPDIQIVGKVVGVFRKY